MQTGQTERVRLGAGSASSCRRRIHLDHDPTADPTARSAPDPAAALIRREIGVHRVEMAARVDVDGARLAQDLRSGSRQAVVDILVPGPDGGWIPVLIKGHRTLDAGAGAVVSSLTDPLRWVSSGELRVRPHHEDALALAHCHRLLGELGLAGPRAVGGVIGRGNADDTTICWYDLAAPGGVAAVSFGAVSFGLGAGGSAADGGPGPAPGSAPSILDDYDARFADRLAVAEAALRRERPLASPSRVSECRRCPWNPVCTVELTLGRDVSLIAPGADAAGLRAVGVVTIDDLALADDDQLAAVAPSRSTGALRGPELRLRARAWQADAVLIRRRDAVQVPRADIELDVDMECFIDDGAYLWGTYLSGTAAGMTAATGAGFEGGYQPFVTWHPLPDRAEGVMFAEFWAYLRELQLVANDAGLTFAAYCYSRQAEERWLFSTPARYPDVPGMPSAQEVRAFTSSASWVDMYEMLGREFLAAGSKRLKTVAPLAGFNWRDPEPDGANSMVWYRAAVGADGAPPSESQKRRLLEYNEDDVLATLALRRWMSDGAAADTPTVAELSVPRDPLERLAG
ncbi:TM0106 family RecB-like putative nuclease [Nakamurella deserti]|uniref:TM0106 family RecB-like putative nuclease n=1 Tax=Nakamurella deserti TaxID=2164074 RepID=UPI000DBE2D1C|nr:TM0106 family RecB-like putative nuclease [Nakamurella deserti]